MQELIITICKVYSNTAEVISDGSKKLVCCSKPMTL
ncbi:MAG: hypothetical protein HOI47_17685 [Candidatus Scalindua sp.]|nr:hypothetical protein [Candidatus Scalindua sp.]